MQKVRYLDLVIRVLRWRSSSSNRGEYNPTCAMPKGSFPLGDSLQRRFDFDRSPVGMGDYSKTVLGCKENRRYEMGAQKIRGHRFFETPIEYQRFSGNLTVLLLLYTLFHP